MKRYIDIVVDYLNNTFSHLTSRNKSIDDRTYRIIAVT